MLAYSTPKFTSGLQHSGLPYLAISHMLLIHWSTSLWLPYYCTIEYVQRSTAIYSLRCALLQFAILQKPSFKTRHVALSTFRNRQTPSSVARIPFSTTSLLALVQSSSGMAESASSAPLCVIFIRKRTSLHGSTM